MIESIFGNFDCSHTDKTGSRGSVAVVAIGRSLPRNDGIAAIVCSRIPAALLGSFCYFDIGVCTGLMGACLQGHKAGIVIDAICTGATAGTTTWCDLGAMLANSCRFTTVHSESLVEDLSLAKRLWKLPERIILLGIEIPQSQPELGLSETLVYRLPELAEQVSYLISNSTSKILTNAANCSS